jgi:hypothetical protein
MPNSSSLPFRKFRSQREFNCRTVGSAERLMTKPLDHWNFSPVVSNRTPSPKYLMFVDKTCCCHYQYIMSSSYPNHVNNNAFYSSDSEEEVDDAATVYRNYFDSSVEENILCCTGGRLTSERIILRKLAYRSTTNVGSFFLSRVLLC